MYSIQKRLNYTYGIVILASFILLGSLLLLPLENYFLEQSKASLAAQIRLSAQVIEPYLGRGDYDNLRSKVADLGKENNFRITVVLADGTVIADNQHNYLTMENHLNRPEIKDASLKGIGYSIRMSDTTRQKQLYCAYTLKNVGHTKSYLRISVSLAHIEQAYAYLRKILFGTLAFVAFLAIVVGIKTARTISKPIAHLKEISGKIAEGDFQARAVVKSDDELGDLATAINAMAEKLGHNIQSLNNEKEQLEIIFEHLGAGVTVINATGKILLINSTAENIFHASRALILGEQFHTLLRDETFGLIFQRVIETEDAQDYEFKYQEKYYKAHFVPLVQNDLETKIVILIYDINPIRQLQQIRSDFVSNASHELRTPLTAIRGYTETLLDGAMHDPEITRSFLGIIDRESQRLTRIVEDLLDLGRLERTTPLKKALFSLKPLIENVTKRYAPAMHKKDIALIVDMSDDLMVYGDYDWLEQVFVNLIDNAVKYSKQGGKLNIAAMNEKDKVVVATSDTGIGIPYHDLPRVFERFYRVDKSRSRSQGGTGLGLAIVKHIVESHQGSITIDSTVGVGTTVHFTIPHQS